jgi:predicted transcriptional regulator
MQKAFKFYKEAMQRQRTILEILFPKARAEIFRLLFGSKRRPRYVREIMRESDLALRSIQDELKRLSAVGLVTSRSNGYHRFFAANTAHPLFREIVRITQMSEELPQTKHTEMFRASRVGTRKRRPRQLGPRFSREPKWGIFSNRRPKT